MSELLLQKSKVKNTVLANSTVYMYSIDMGCLMMHFTKAIRTLPVLGPRRCSRIGELC